MFYVGNLILFYETNTFIKGDLLWDNSIVPKRYILRMTYFPRDTLPPKFEKHFFPQNIHSVYCSLRLYTYSCSWFMVSFIPFSLFCCCSESLYSFSCLFETFSSTISIFFLKSFRRSLLSANFSRKAVISLAFALKYLWISLIPAEKTPIPKSWN